MRTLFEMTPNCGGRVTIATDIETSLITIDAFNSALDSTELEVFRIQLDFAENLIDEPEPAPKDETVYDEPCLPKF